MIIQPTSFTFLNLFPVDHYDMFGIDDLHLATRGHCEIVETHVDPVESEAGVVVCKQLRYFHHLVGKFHL